MSFSSTVDHRYRLIAADLGGRSRSVIVTRVSYQGVESLQPLLHFEGIPKPLALDMTQRLTVAQIARSTAVSDWVGLMMELHPIEQDRQAWIEITPVGGKRLKSRTAPNPAPQRRPAAPNPASQPLVTTSANLQEPKVNDANANVRRNTAKNDAARVVAESQTALEQRIPQPWFSSEDIPQTPVWTPILLGVLLVLAFVAAYQIETNAAAWQWLSSLLSF